MATRTINSAIALPALTLAGTLQLPPKIDAALTLPAVSITGELTKQILLTLNADLALPALQITGTLARPNKVDAPIVLPGIVVSAAIRIPIRKTLTAIWTLSKRCAANHVSRWSMSARDAAATVTAQWALTYTARAQHEIIWYGPRVLAILQDRWSLRLGAQHVAVWPVGHVTADLVSRWSAPLTWTHAGVWASAPVIRINQQARWACMPRLRTALAAQWGQMRSGIRHRLDLSWSGTARGRTDLATVWALRDERVCRQQEVQWISGNRERAVFALSARWAGAEGQTLPLPEIALTLGGTAIPAVGCELRFDPDSPAATALVTPAIWPEQLPPSGTEAVLSIDGAEWKMVLTSGDGQASGPVAVEASLQLASPCIALETAEPVTLPYGGLASEIAAAAVAPLVLIWSLPDWYLPPPLVAAHLGTQSPLATAKALANAAGGMLMSLPSGTLLALPKQGGIRLDLGCAIESERTVAAAQYSGVRVRAAEPGASINVVGDAPGLRTLDIGVLPWRPVTTELYAGADAGLSEPVEALRETTEQIQIIDGVAELVSPVVELIGIEWSDGAERVLRTRGRWAWTEDRNFTGLCSVTYRYRVLSLTASRTLQRDALAAVYEQEKTV
ncbi:MAG: hypothetical protein BWY57_03024 [Betaproteobacteria bacterium ADurb.Bin341]|nr:MAG: hypothetical protein BWY57_03024 [Betaproteobacteria bacterium ADurb.Bin341]